MDSSGIRAPVCVSIITVNKSSFSVGFGGIVDEDVDSGAGGGFAADDWSGCFCWKMNWIVMVDLD